MEQTANKSLELKKEFGLRLLCEDKLQYRPLQWPVLRAILSSDERLLISAETGAGKTVLFILKALQRIARGERVVLATVRKHLVEQFRQLALELSHLRETDILVSTGNISPDKRVSLYQQRAKFIIATREVVDNDIDSGIFVWDSISLVGLDEIHHAQKDDVYVALVNRLKPRPLQLLYFSATAASDLGRLIKLIDLLEFDRHFIMPNRQEYFIYNSRIVDIDDDLETASAYILDKISYVYHVIQYALEKNVFGQQLELLNCEQYKPKTVLRQAPSYWQHNQLKRLIINSGMDKKDIAALMSWWAELGYICWLYELLLTCGRYAFLQDFAYRYAKFRIYPTGISLPEFEKNKDKKTAYYEKRALRRLWQIFGFLAKGTPYYLLAKETNWYSVLEQAHLGFDGYFLKFDQWQDKVRQFYRLAMKTMAESEKPDHPKMPELMKILQEHTPEANGQVVIFTGTRRHAEFLSRSISHKMSVLRRKVVYAYSPDNARQKKIFNENLQKFRDNDADLLVTSDYCREGIDVPKAQVLIEYMTLDTSPIKKRQGRGRVGRNPKHGNAHVYFLLTRQSGELKRLLISIKRDKKMIGNIRRNGELFGLDVLDENPKEVNHGKMAI